MPFNIGPGELILILIIALVVLGPGKLPDVAASLGKGLREFRKAASDVADAGKLDTPAPAPPAAPQQQAAPPAPAQPAATQPTALSERAQSEPDASAPPEPAGESNES